MRMKEWNKKLKLYPLFEKLCLSVFIIIFGNMLTLMNHDIGIDMSAFTQVPFFIAITIILLYVLFQTTKYKKPLDMLCHCVNYLRVVIWFQFFLLAVSKNLQFLELINGLTTICLIEIIQSLPPDPDENKQTQKSLESDWPTTQLYDTRKKQLKRFAKMMHQQKEEPYAIMISEQWGTGKTSFVKALQKELVNDEFIWIRAGGEKNISEIMKDISTEIIKILKANNIYIEKSELIDKYFLSFTEMINQSSWGIFNKILQILNLQENNANTYNYINGKLRKLEKTIFLIIDDLDRCDDEYRDKMFKVIRESTVLHNCKTIFLADQSMFMSEKCDMNYIEKYVSYNLQLCRVDYKEIVDFYLSEILTNDFISSINQEITQNKVCDSIHQEITSYPDSVLESLERHKLGLQKEAGHESDVNSIENLITTIQKNVSNSRKVKNFLKGIKSDFSHLNEIWGVYTNDYKSKNWIEIIIKVQFIKQILPNEYYEILKYPNLGTYYNHCDIAMNTILKYGQNSDFDTTNELLNYAFYKLDTIDFTLNKSEQQHFIDELHGETPDILNFQQYIKYIPDDNYSDYDILLKLYKCANNLTSFQKAMFYEQLLDKITPDYFILSKNYLELTNKVIKTLSAEKNLDQIINIRKYSRNIIDNCIGNNNRIFKKPLYIKEGVDFIEKRWETLSVYNVEIFCKKLAEIDNNFMYNNYIEDSEKLELIEAYYRKLENDFIQKSDSINIDIQKLFAPCYLIFEICKSWSKFLSPQKISDEPETIEKYFDLKTFTFKEPVFNSPQTLKNALSHLKTYYESIRNKYHSEQTMLLYRTVYQMLKILNERPNWYNNDSSSLSDEISCIAELVYKLDTSHKEEDINNIEMLKIFIYDFKKLCQTNGNNEIG